MLIRQIIGEILTIYAKKSSYGISPEFVMITCYRSTFSTRTTCETEKITPQSIRISHLTYNLCEYYTSTSANKPSPVS